MRRAVLAMILCAGCAGDTQPRAYVGRAGTPAGTSGTDMAHGTAATHVPPPAVIPSPAAPSLATPPDAGGDDEARMVAEIVASVDRLPAFTGAPRAPASNARNLLDTAMDSLDSFHRQPANVLVAIDAVRAAPSSAPARYVLACALSARAMHDQAHAVLDALRAAPHCEACSDALLNARHDDECVFEPRDVALAVGATPSALRTAADAVLGALATGDLAPASAYLDAQPATFWVSGSNCDRECTSKRVYPRAELIALIRGAEQRAADQESYLGPTRMFCENGCCEGPNPCHSHASRTHVRKVCFRAGPPLHWTSISAIKGG